MAASVMDENGRIAELKPDVKIVVVGESKCGKTSFIRAFYDENISVDTYPDHVATVYLCGFEFGNEHRLAAIIDVPCLPDDLVEDVIADHVDANGVVFMYAIDDPSSFLEVTEKWIPVIGIHLDLEHIATMAVGFKVDLREDQQVIDRLEQDNQAPVSERAGKCLAQLPEIQTSFECSSKTLDKVTEAFHFILSHALNVKTGSTD